MRVGCGVAALVVVVALGGCRTLLTLSRPTLPPCATPLVSTEAMGEKFWARYGVRVRVGEVDERFTLVAERSDAGLALVAWNPFGAELFALVQEGSEVVQRGAVLPGFPVPPRNVLGDLHRLRFLGEGGQADDGGAEVHSCGATTTFTLVEERPPR